MAAKSPKPDPAPPVAWPKRLLAPLLGVTRVFSKISRRGRIALALGVLTVAANLGLLLAWIHYRPKPVETVSKKDYLPAAFAALDRGAYSDAKRLAALARDQGGESAESGGPSFVQGAATANEADAMWEDDQRRYYVLAARHLADARTRGWPKAREAEGLFLLGKSLCISHEYSASRPILEQALEANPEHAEEIHWLLSRAYHLGPEPDFAKALDHNAQYLANDQLSHRERYEGLLIKGQILFTAGRAAECLKVLAEIPADSPSFADATVLQGQLLMQAAAKLASGGAPDAPKAMQQKYREAIDTLRKAQTRGRASEQVVPQSMYLIGECFLAMADAKAALDQFSRTQQGYPESAEGVAAGFQVVDLLRQLNQDEEAIAALRRAVAAVGDPAEFRNPLITVEAIRQRLLDAYQTYLASEHFERAIEVSGMLFPLFPRERQIELSAQAHQAWAAALEKTVDRVSASDSREKTRQARAQLRKAGAEYSRLAELQLASRAYPDYVWDSAEAFLAGHDFDDAVRMYDEYLRYELRKRRPRALLSLGEAHLALENFARALDALNECIVGYPSDAASYRARLLAAKAHIEMGDNPAAEKLLRENLEDGYLTPKSLEWRDSLLAYGMLLQAEGRDEEAIPRLDEYVQRYPDSRQVIDARYLIAEAYRRSAQIPRQKLETDTIESSRAAHNLQMKQLLSAAIDQYEQVQDWLTRRQEQTDLDLSEQAILRNCYFARGAAMYDMGRYDDAILAYSAAMNHYQRQPEVLEALMQIAACYRRLGKVEEARGTLEQAKVMLARLNPNVPFKETTNYTRQEWSQVLDWYTSL